MARSQPRFAVVVVMIAAGILAACVGDDAGQGGQKADSVPPPRFAQDSHDYATCSLQRPGMLTDKRQTALADSVARWSTWNIPEYQDAQRFTDLPARTYGPLACVVANPYLTQLTDADYVAGALVAVIYLDSVASTRPYTELYLTGAGFYCVILKGTVSTSGLDAYVVPSTNKQCGDPSPATRLRVGAPLIQGATSASDIPAVARFVTKRSWRPGLGVRCKDRWCNIAVNALDIDPPAQGTLATTAPGYIKHTVIGWFDQQQLALAEPGNPLKASLRASVVPTDSLDAYDLNRFSTRTPVAQVYFADDPKATKYDTVWAFKKGQNSMELMQASAGAWQVYINGALNSKLRVVRTGHESYNMHVVGTARWHWKDDDEAVWVRCAEGCCRVEEVA